MTQEIDPKIQQVIDGIRTLAEAGEVGITATIVSQQHASRCLAWPLWCALDADGDTVKGIKSLEAYEDTDAAAVAISKTSGLLMGQQQQRRLQEQVETVLAELGGSMDIEACRQAAGQEDAESA